MLNIYICANNFSHPGGFLFGHFSNNINEQKNILSFFTRGQWCCEAIYCEKYVRTHFKSAKQKNKMTRLKSLHIPSPNIGYL